MDSFLLPVAEGVPVTEIDVHHFDDAIDPSLHTTEQRACWRLSTIVSMPHEIGHDAAVVGAHALGPSVVADR